MQTVVRTRLKDGSYLYDPNAFKDLKEKLNQGWTVVMVHEIGRELEYILESPDRKAVE